jgi:hypothetical protein
MNNAIADFEFTNGVSGELNMDTDNADTGAASAFTHLRQKLAPVISQHRLSGKIIIEINGEKIYLSIKASPDQFQQALADEAKKLYTFQQISF